jgi:Ala-tRNA(Pro) deacylase
MLAKVVIVEVGARFVMLVTPAPAKVHIEKLKQLFRGEDVRMAIEDEMRRLFPDCELGAEPPFGNLYDMETLIDRRLTLQDEIVFQSGTHTETLRISYGDYERLARPRVAEFTLPAEARVA